MTTYLNCACAGGEWCAVAFLFLCVSFAHKCLRISIAPAQVENGVQLPFLVLCQLSPRMTTYLNCACAGGERCAVATYFQGNLQPSWDKSKAQIKEDENDRVLEYDQLLMLLT